MATSGEDILPAPTNVKATVLKCDIVEVTWDQSPEATGYLISCTSTVSYAGSKTVMVSGGDKTFYKLTGLVENTPYDITVQSLTKAGKKSEHSTKQSITTIKAAPGAPPQDIKISGIDPASLLVSWQPPLKKHHNGSITGYVIQYARVGSDDRMSVNVPNDANFIISGLFAYVEYSVTVAAVNANGTGPFSKPVTAISGENTPSKPHWMETESVSSSTVTLKWVPPTYPNGVVIKYCVHFDGKHIDDFGDKVSDMLRGTVKGLSPDTEYVFEMKAHTKVGPGPSVDLSVRTRIPAPTNVKATVLTRNSVEVKWDQSPDVIGYLISCTSTASYAGGKSVMVNGGDKTSHAFTDLIENTPYSITVRGITGDGRKSEHSTEVLLTTQKAAPSSPPQDIKVLGVNPASLVVSWQPPLKENGSEPITGYVIQYARDESDDKMIMNIPNDVEHKIKGLFPYAKYSVTVAAVNVNGTGPFSKPVIATSGEDTPSEPCSLKADSFTSTSVTLQWMPPKRLNGVITQYSVQYDGKDFHNFGNNVSNKMMGTVEGLSPDTEYLLQLKAHTKAGEGYPASLYVKTASISVKKHKSEVSFIPVGKSVHIECDGKYGGSYLWKRHGFAIMLPPGCADGTVNVTIKAYLPTSTQEHPIVSAVFGITTNINNFKKPITLRFPHCVTVKSEKDKEKLRFLLLHHDTYRFNDGYFEVGESVGSIELNNFCKVCIFGACFASIISMVSPSNFTIESSENIRGEQGKIDKNCLDLLILPKSHIEIRDWHGTYCIIWDIPTYLPYFDAKNWIKPSREVLKRKVNFTRNADDAIAEICLANEDKDGNIIELAGNTKISRQQISSASISLSDNDIDSCDDAAVESFPRCFLHIYEKIETSSRLKIDGVCASGKESSEFNLASPTLCDFKFEVCDFYSEESDIIIIKPSKPKELIVTKDGVTETEVTLQWNEPIPQDPSISGYEVQYKKSGEDVYKKKRSPICKCEVPGLTANTKYEFKVAAINSAGCGRFTDAVIQSTKRSNKPSLKENTEYNIRDEVAVDWYDLGVQLQLDTSKLDIISVNHSGNTEICCNKMFNKWLEVDTTASWNKLMEALRRINKNKLAGSISRKLLQDFT